VGRLIKGIIMKANIASVSNGFVTIWFESDTGAVCGPRDVTAELAASVAESFNSRPEPTKKASKKTSKKKVK